MTKQQQDAVAKSDKRVERLIDANINRLREGLRTIEDVARYIMNSHVLSRKLKELRHKVKSVYDPARLSFRDVENDVLKESTESEMDRSTLSDILSANFSRAQESSRVLEECFKLTSPSYSTLFKHIRYDLYSIEKEFFNLFDSQKHQL